MLCYSRLCKRGRSRLYRVLVSCQESIIGIHDVEVAAETFIHGILHGCNKRLERVQVQTKLLCRLHGIEQGRHIIRHYGTALVHKAVHYVAELPGRRRSGTGISLGVGVVYGVGHTAGDGEVDGRRHVEAADRPFR